MPNTEFKVPENLNQLDGKVLLSTVNPLDAFINTQVAADIVASAKSVSTTITDLKTNAPTSPTVQLDFLQVNRNLAVANLDQGIDNALGSSTDPLAEQFYDKAVTTDIQVTQLNVATWQNDLKTNAPDSTTVQLDELQVQRDLLIANLDQSVDLSFDT